MPDIRKLTPIYAETNHNRGRLTIGYGPEDFALIVQGYACGECCEVFNVGGSLIVLDKCPTCRQPTTVGAGAEILGDSPQDWIDYERYRKAMLEEPLATPRRK